MDTAFSYARVSTKEQEENKNSIPEQFQRNKVFAVQNNIIIKREFSDSDSAFHDENRDNFNTMLELALKERPNYIIFDDSSRFARTKKVAIDTKQKLRSHGINILYASEPNIDSNTIAGFWLEGIQEIKNEATSREISFHTKKGMTGNLQNRDSETGWCYKNGGKAPYGYKRKILDKGFNKKGKPIYKTIWELDEFTSKIIRKVIVDLYTNQKMSYQSIRDYLNNNHIPNSNGGLWSTSTIASMLREDRLEEYAGIAIWNKENKNIIGVKYNDRDKWVICENAHPAIITKEELVSALERKRKTNNNNGSYLKNQSEYLLSGLNSEQNFIFTCSQCGSHVIGISSGKKHIKKYGCSSNNHKGIHGCENNWKIEKDWIENKIMSIIEENYVCPSNLEILISKTLKQLASISNEYDNIIKNIEKKYLLLDKQLQNLINSIKNGINPAIIAEEVNNIKNEKDNLLLHIQNIKKEKNIPNTITKKEIISYYRNIQKVFVKATINEKKELLKTFISNISLNYCEHEVEISLYPQGFAVLEQVAGIEPA